jgi:hypothetical protein
MIFMASILHSKCMCLWDFYFSHADEIGFLLCQGFDKLLKRRHLPGGSRGKFDGMECGYEHREFRTKFGENGENRLFLLLRFINPTSFEL